MERLGGWVAVPTGLRCRLLTPQPLSASSPSAHAAAWPSISRAAQCLTPLSLLKGLPASSCSPTAHRPRGFSPPSFSFLPRPSPPFQLPQPYPNPQPQFACAPQSTITTTNLLPPHLTKHYSTPWCSSTLRPGSQLHNPCYILPVVVYQPSPAQPISQARPFCKMDPPNKRRRLAPKVPEPAPIPTASATAAAAATVPTPATTPQQAQYSPEQVSIWIN